MRFLLLLLKRARVLILFLLLEALAFFLIFQERSYQRSAWLNSTNAITARSLERYHETLEYLYLKEENDNLARENARLRNLLDRSRIYQAYGADTIGDSLSKQRYTIIPGKAINSSFLKKANYLTLNVGTESGVDVGMGVAGPQGAIGVIEHSSRHFSTALPLINPQLSITARIAESDFFGPLLWTGEDYRFAYLEDIPRYAEIEAGDSVITDSRSAVFPAGIAVGTVVESTLQDDQNFLRIKVRLSTDFSQLNHVYVIKDLLKAELDSL